MRALAVILFLSLLPGPAMAQDLVPANSAEAAMRFERAAGDYEEAAVIWENMNDRVQSAMKWNLAADNWEQAARAWEEAGRPEEAREAMRRFQAALERRDSIEIHLDIIGEPTPSVRAARVSPPLSVRVTDNSGAPVPGITVRYEISSVPSGGEAARLSVEEVSTGPDGAASSELELGTAIGYYIVTAAVPGLTREPVTFRVRGTPGPAASMRAVAGNHQVILVNQVAVTPLTVRVGDIYGNPVPDETVRFRIVAQPGEALGSGLSADAVVTEPDGTAGIRFRSGSVGGVYTILAESGDLDGSPLRFDVTARQTIPTIHLLGVRIEGSSDTVALVAGTRLRVGETYLLPELARQVRLEMERLYATGRFSNIESLLDTDEENGGTNIVFVVNERARFGPIEISGERRVREDALRTVLTIAEGGFYSEAAVERSRIALLDKYEDEGYIHAVVDAETEVNADGRVEVAFEIDERSRIKVGRLNFHGNEVFGNWSLNWHMRTGAGRVYQEEVFAEDREKVLRKYAERGYITASMDDPVISYDERGRLVLDITIHEGPRYTVAEPEFTGNTVVPSQTLADLMRPRAGEVFRPSRFFRSLEKMRMEFARLGYAEAVMDPDIRPNPLSGIVDLTIRIHEGHVLYLDRIVVSGNTETREDIITREIRIAPGEMINGEELDEARRRLENLQIFEPGSVVMDLVPVSNDPSDDRRALSVQVREGRTGQIQFGAGYSSVDHLIGFLSFTKRNFDPWDPWGFTGAGQIVSLSSEFGGRRSSYSLSWTEPWWRGRPLSVGFDLFNIYQEREGYDWTRRGGAIRLSHPWREVNRIHYRYTYRRVEAEDIISSAPTEIRDEAGYDANNANNRFERTTTSLALGLTRDTRDSYRFPRHGFRFEIEDEHAARFLGGNVSYNKPSVSFSLYRPGIFNHAIAFRYVYSTMSNFFDRSNTIPNFEKFVLGGANTVRGYGERELQVYSGTTLEGGGLSSSYYNLEYRIPIDEEAQFSLALFTDGGNVFRDEWTLKPSDFARSVGFGVRFETPLGPIRIDYGYGLDFPNENQGEIHFNIGQAF